jgi:hypothetical protein
LLRKISTTKMADFYVKKFHIMRGGYV